ncbi:cytochrome P450 [Limnoraphis robusta Tam1]|uniref:Cytochrome P450 n=1 Tax=Limnoraphis robusta CCNP1315 TaxID=3110306 RepID=A0ABU5U3Q9_9CYAN|nr:cytochrome P450 [Limnoraphis robusta]MEA5498923.1 cytochrome P450 [Limnoraphis robusta BA-68 BA1]MEA5521828.1 cytochrome P450 [Limnoraphis robusta CCNP1315]MEA5540473.1 cytochrome P450 [Limnoraphis robusta Tam1]MEA5543976.1 cytochrome P450 [Limnoraphis robusta CCNP1324]
MTQVESLKIPIWMQRIEYITNPVSYWERAYRTYSDGFWAKGIDFGRPLVVFYTPEAAQQIIENRHGHLTTTAFDSELKAIFGDSSFFTLEGMRHQQVRKLLIPKLHGKCIHSYGQLICDLVNDVMQAVPAHQPFLVWETAQEISMQVMIKLLFGSYQQERYQQIKRLMVEMIGLFASNIVGIPLFFRFLQQDFGSFSPWGNFLKERQQMQELIYSEIAERRSHPDLEKPDILTLLMSATDEQGNSLTDEELLGQVLSLLFTGNESTAASIAWSWYRVYGDAEIQARLWSELNSLGNSPDPLDLLRLPYLSAVCNETLRMYPVTMFMIPRLVKATTKISDRQLDPGTLVTVGTYVIHHREDIYPQPETFKPERFLNHRFSPYEFLPFGGGMRGCIGGEIALYQLKLALAMVVSRYQLELMNHRPIFPQRRNTVLMPTQLRMTKHTA